MLDRTDEQTLYPRTFLQPAALQSVLCVAPHPDDEVLGCAGLLVRIRESGGRIHTVVLTGGEAGGSNGSQSVDLVHQRRQESRLAASLLQLPQPTFEEFSDRGLSYAEPLISCIQSHLQRTQAKYLLLPALSEPHPDHQAASLAGLAAATRVTAVQAVLFYEVGAPTVPNCLVDITSTALNKWQALAVFQSQMGLQRYEDHAQAMSTLRAFGAGGSCVHAEAFFWVDMAQIRSQGAAAALPHWPLLRQQAGLANLPSQLPLVSILIRSMDRPALSQALASVLAQTYSNMEIVVVNACGKPHSDMAGAANQATIRMVNPPQESNGKQQKCTRAQAANLALAGARGDLALFLDDDDLIAPHHVERLVKSYLGASDAVGAYAGIRVEGAQGVYIRDYDLPWSRHRLNAINFLPIHAVLFSMSVIRENRLIFDETLPVLEDWEFWRNLCVYGHLVHCPGISGTYRQGLGDSHLGSPDHAHYWKTWHAKLIERKIQSAPLDELGESLAWHAIELDSTQTLAAALSRQCDDLGQNLERATQQNVLAAQQHEQHILRLTTQYETSLEHNRALQNEQQATLKNLTQQISVLQSDLIAARAQIQGIQHSLSWRLTRPLRAIKALLISK